MAANIEITTKGKIDSAREAAFFLQILESVTDGAEKIEVDLSDWHDLRPDVALGLRDIGRKARNNGKPFFIKNLGYRGKQFVISAGLEELLNEECS